MLDWMAGKTEEPAPEPTKIIACRFGDIIILGPDRFFISEFAQFGGHGLYVPSTDDLDTIEAILNRPDWTELEVNEAVATLVAAEDRERQSNVANRRNFMEDAE